MKTLTRVEAHQAMDRLMEGDFEPEKLTKWLEDLTDRGETVEELIGFAQSILAHAKPMKTEGLNLIDTCGTGGDGGKTFNISTAVSFVLAGGGLKVAKHGNRSFSSKSGSADVYEALGLKIHEDVPTLEKSLQELGFAFLYAPYFHPALKNVAEVRKSIGSRTVFNILGPLVNPARAKRQVLGVYNQNLTEKMALTLKELGTVEALVVCSDDSLDELSLTTATRGIHLKNGVLNKVAFIPEEAGLTRVPLSNLQGGNATENALIIERILKKEKGPRRDVVVLNAAAGFWIAGLAPDLRGGAALAQASIDSGKAHQVLTNLRNEK